MAFDEKATTLPCARKDHETVLDLIKRMRTLPRQLWLTWSDLSSFAQCVCNSQPYGHVVPVSLITEAIAIAEKTAELETQIGSAVRIWVGQDSYAVGQAKWTELQEIFRRHLEKIKPEPEPEKKSLELTPMLTTGVSAASEEDEEDFPQPLSETDTPIAIAALPGGGESLSSAAQGGPFHQPQPSVLSNDPTGLSILGRRRYASPSWTRRT